MTPEPDSPHYSLADVLAREYRLLRDRAAPEPPAVTTDTGLRLSAIQAEILGDPKPLAALCLSGGGIRSATFALGVLQGLAKRGLLGPDSTEARGVQEPQQRIVDRFDYLSTVSGGGYVGSWLSAWVYRHPEGMAGVIKALKAEPGQGDKHSQTRTEAEPIQHLREYSNYLSPRLGLLSADAWTLAATYLRNLILNWLIIIPLLLLILLAPRFMALLVGIDRPHPVGAIALIVFAALLIFGALAYVGLDRPGGGNRKWPQGRFLRLCLAPLTIAGLMITVGLAWIRVLQASSGGWWLDFDKLKYYALLGIPIYGLAWAMHLLPDEKYKTEKLVEDNGLRRLTSKAREGLAALATGAVGGMLLAAWTALFAAPTKTDLGAAIQVCFAAPLLLIAFTLTETFFIGLASRVTNDEDREWWARSGAWILIVVLTWSSLSAVVIFGTELLFWLNGAVRNYLAAAGGVTGAIAIWAAKSPLTAGSPEASPEPRQAAPLRSRLMTLALALTAPLFVVILLIFLSYATDGLLTGRWPVEAGSHFTAVFEQTSARRLLVVAGLLPLLSLFMGCFININRFSLHAMYRNRLIRAYLGASRKTRQPGTVISAADEAKKVYRDPHPFTGFDPDDNLHMHELRPTADQLPANRPPLHVVNIALNLVQGGRLAWQQRKAESFTVTPLHSGGGCVGYRDSRRYGDPEDGISLGTAVAISGAAASPNMGYHSSPALTFLMSLFNARLGWWLGNPCDDRTWSKKGPDFAVAPLIDETFGLTTDDSPWVYLSDGGHFENLGLYEMVVRRCRLIVVVDAGCDPKGLFEDFGNAIRKIRTDLGVPIEIENQLARLTGQGGGQEGELPKTANYCAVYTIGYSRVHELIDARGAKIDVDGRLLYIKPAVYGNEPIDVYNYARSNALFPHEPTSDQFFSESQFESYRMLGSHIIERLPHSTRPGLDGLIEAASATMSSTG